MTKHKGLAAIFCACALLLGGCATEGGAPPGDTAAPVQTAQTAEKTTGTGFYFDTVVTLTLYGAPEGLMDELWADCARYEQLLSKTIAESDVSRINAAEGATVTVDPETWAILSRAKEISDLSGHAFSVTIAPLTALWDFTGGTERMPTDEERLAALPLVDDDALVLGENSTVILPAGMEIDLGGIAKGYIADRMADKVRGLTQGAMLNFGGNVYAVGEKPDGSAFVVGIQDPQSTEGAAIAAVSVRDRTVVTSGIYERCFFKDGVRYHHILDPKTGLPSDSDLASATIVTDSSMTADALATACIVLGKDASLKLLEGLGLDGLLITRDNEIFTTDGFADDFPLQTKNP